MNFYQRPTYHWKRECVDDQQWQGKNKSINGALLELEKAINQEPIYMPMLNVYKKYAGWALGAYCLTTFIAPPVGVIVGSGILIKPYITT